MTAFDRAWWLLKMPIVQGSVQRDYQAEEDDPKKPYTKRYKASFDDPESGERLGMEGALDFRRLVDGDTHNNPHWAKVTINELDDDTYKLHPRASATFEARDPLRPEDMIATGVGVDDDYRRRGYATAIYDMVAYLLNRHNEHRLLASGDQTVGGKALWGSRQEGPSQWLEQEWPVRGDLG